MSSGVSMSIDVYKRQVVACVYGAKHGYVMKRDKMTAAIILKTIWEAIPSLFLIVIIIGGILSGYFTPTEASGVAVVYAFLLSVFVYKSIQIKDIPKILVDTAVMTTIVMLIIGASSVPVSYTHLDVYKRQHEKHAEGPFIRPADAK